MQNYDTPLHWAAQFGNTSVVRLLLADPRVEVSTQNTRVGGYC